MSGPWKKFFMDAGIPIGPASEYATVFSDNRMRMDMLKDLTKDILHDLGVIVMGDVLAILRHSKKVSAQLEREKLDGSERPAVKESAATPKSNLGTSTRIPLPPKSVMKTPSTQTSKVAQTTPPPKATSIKGTVAKKAPAAAAKKPPSTASTKPVTASTVLSKATVVLATAAKTSRPRKTLSQRFTDVAVAPKKPKMASTVVTRLPLPPDESSAKKASVEVKTKAAVTGSTLSSAAIPSAKPVVAKKVEKVEPVKPARQVSVFSRLGEDNPTVQPSSKTSNTQAVRIDKTVVKVVEVEGTKDEEGNYGSVFKRLGGEKGPAEDTNTRKVFRRLGSKAEDASEALLVSTKSAGVSVQAKGSAKPFAKSPLVLSAASQINHHLGISKPVKHVRPVQSATIVKRETKLNTEKGVFRRLGDRN